jgi:hypothetical protein
MKAEITIAENLNELTLTQYSEFIKIEEPTNIDILSSFLDISKDDVYRIKEKDIESLTSGLNDLFKKDHVFVDRFKLNGVIYGFIPKLDDITYGENKDLTAYLNWDSMHKAMAVMYRPIKQSQGGKYIIEDYEGSSKYSEEMREAPLGVVFGAMVFFWSLTSELLRAIPSYLERELKTQQTQSQVSEENGEVIKKYIVSLRETLEDLTKLQDYRYTNV